MYQLAFISGVILIGLSLVMLVLYFVVYSKKR